MAKKQKQHPYFRENMIALMEANNIGATKLSQLTGVKKQVIDKLHQRRVSFVAAENAVKIAKYFDKAVEDMSRPSIDEIRLLVIDAIKTAAPQKLLEALRILTES